MSRGGAPVEGVVLDMDGLMVDSEPVYQSAATRALADLGLRLDDAGYHALVGLDEADTERSLRETYGPGFRPEDYRERCERYWREAIGAGALATKPGLLELLADLESRSLPLAVATSSDAARTGASLRAAGIEGRFEAVVTRDQVARGKPAPDLYLCAAQRIGVAPQRCLALEDSEPGMRAAVAAGMRVLVVPDLVRPSAHVRRTAHAVLGSLHDARRVVAELFAAG